jgi:hypothetical protein
MDVERRNKMIGFPKLGAFREPKVARDVTVSKT